MLGRVRHALGCRNHISEYDFGCTRAFFRVPEIAPAVVSTKLSGAPENCSGVRNSAGYGFGCHPPFGNYINKRHPMRGMGVGGDRGLGGSTVVARSAAWATCRVPHNTPIIVLGPRQPNGAHIHMLCGQIGKSSSGRDWVFGPSKHEDMDSTAALQRPTIVWQFLRSWSLPH